ncbi:MAG: hypothetical protein IKT40_07385 [Bacilli bacterium]|nr:hypothetical protein [Bacilli bacterium]
MSVNKNVLYVEPNYTSSEIDILSNGKVNLKEMAPDLSDFCIAVDLEVEVHNRVSDAVSTQGGKVIIVKFASGDKKDNYSVSFLSGTKCRYGEKEVNYYTTAPYDTSTMKDILNGNGTSEMFGINSIDIEYDNYMVPVVTINFTDIRGISLFAEEELRHSKSYNGIKGYSDDDIAGSFFKCFFTFPYPKFSLMVKGFYGLPVTYELTCAEFRAGFDSSTGNFNAVAKFIGYSFALINDVTMNALVAAPLSKYIGSDYWENKQFRFESDNSLMPKLNDVLKRYKSLQEAIIQLKKDDPSYLEQTRLEKELSNVDNLAVLFNDYYANVKSLLSNTPFLFDDENKVIVAALNNDFDIKQFNNSINSSKTRFINSWQSIYTNSKSIVSLVKYDDKSLNNSDILKNLYGSLLSNIENKDGIVYYCFDGYETNEKISKKLETLTTQKRKTDKEVSERMDTDMGKILGFKPTVKNVTDLLLAHLETLLKCIYSASNEVGTNRRLKGLKYTDVDLSNNKSVGLFPKVGILSDDKLEDSWIGDIEDGEDSPELKLIHGLLNGIDEFNKTSNNVVSSLEEYNKTDFAVDFPVAYTDLISGDNPFNGDIDYTNLSDFVGRLFIRMANTIGSKFYFNESQPKLFEQMGIADAHNFYKLNQSPNSNFLNIIHSGLLNTPEKIIEYALNTSKQEKPNPWDTEQKGNTNLVRANDSDLIIDKLYYSNNDGFRCNVLPFIGGTWSRLNDLIGNADATNSVLKSDNNDDNYIAENELFIDTNWKKYTKVCEDIYEDKKFNKLKEYFNISYDSNKLNKYYGANSVWKSTSLIQNIFRLRYDEIESSDTFINSLGYKDGDYDKYYYKDYINTENVMYYITSNNKIKELKRKNESLAHKRIKSCLDDFSNLDNYTISQIPGYRNGTVSLQVSLFAQKEYYDLDIYGKAYVFLNLFNFNSDLEDFIIHSSKHMEIVPYLLVLQYGAYYYYKDNEDNIKLEGDFNIDYLKEPFRITEIRDDIKNRFKKEFIDWVDNYFANEIHLPFAISDGNYDVLTKEISETTPSDYNQCNIHLNCVNSNTYSAIVYKHYAKECAFINNQDSKNVQYVRNLLIQPCILIKTIAEIVSTPSFIFNISRSSANCYLKGFLSELNGLYANLRNVGNIKSTKVEECTLDKNIKIALYNYLKILWDRWLSGTENWENVWSLDSFKRKWHFMDSFYNKIGESATINLNNVVNDLILCQEQKGYSLLTYLSGIYSKDRLNLYCVQNFLDMQNINKMNEMFKPLPYNMITNEMLSRTSDFVVVHTSEYSSKLNLDGSEYLNDSYDINGIDLPQPIVSKKPTDYKIPAFGVTYGKQYQHYFNDISVSMDAPIATEQALLAKFQIAGMHTPTTGESGKKVIPLGADLYTIYSNNSYTCTVKMMGCAWIQPLMIFQLNNIPMFRGSYLIQKVSHHIEPGNMITTFVGTRMSKYSTKLIDGNSLVKENTENGGDNLSLEGNADNKSPNICNDCDYKFFNVINTEENGIPNLSKKELVDSLFNAIKETVDKTENMDVIRDTVNNNILNENNGILRIHSKKDYRNHILFDIVLNTYMDYVEELTWVSDDLKSEPKGIIIKATNNKYSNKRVAIKDDYDNIIQVSDDLLVNEYFYMAIKKRYGNNLEKYNFKTECPNFVTFINKHKDDWKKLIINKLNKHEVESCTNSIEYILDNNGNETFSYGSFHNTVENDYKNQYKPIPLSTKNGIDIANMAKYAAENVKPEDQKGGECALYVKNAMINGGNFKLQRWPKSACVYYYHLPHWGFNIVAQGTNHDGNTFKFKNGDISVAAASRKHEHGHIQIYYNGKWYSDKGYYSIGGYKDSGIPYTIFRYKG